MTSSVTRSSRSFNKKSNITENLSKVNKTTLLKKKKQRQHKKEVDFESRSKQESLLEEDDITKHPEYQKMKRQIDQSYQERLHKIEARRNLERQSILDWFDAQKRQANNDFHFGRMNLRSDLIQTVQNKITRLKQELSLLKKQTKSHYISTIEDYQDWVPPDRLYTIGSFVGGATNEEIDRDLMYARQPYHGTPHLVYSDFESKSTSDTAESRTENNSLSSDPYQQEQRYLPPIHHHNNISYPSHEFEQTSQNGRDWWSYRSSTTTA